MSVGLAPNNRQTAMPWLNGLTRVLWGSGHRRRRLRFRSLRGAADPSCRMDHVYEGRAHLFPLTGLEAAVRIDPYLIGRKTLLRLVEKRRHLVDAWTTRRMNDVNDRVHLVALRKGLE